MRRLVLLIVLAVAAAAVVVVSLPPRAAALDETPAIPAHVRGVVHVHSRASDGSGTVEQIAAAAARAGLDFVVITDHGNAVRLPERPAYKEGVLVVDAVEVGTEQGHVMALGLEESAPYPLGGQPHAAIEDIRRAGAMSLVAHPASSRAAFGWTEWDAPFDAIEWLNADSEWRDESAPSLVRALFTYPWRRSEVLASLLDRPEALLRQWDALIANRRVAALAGMDAHANLGFSGASNRYGDRALLALPGYEPMFRTFSLALPGLRLTGNAADDSRELIGHLREGRAYTAIDAFAAPARLSFVARAGGRTAGPGERLDARGGVTFEVASTAPPGARVRLLRNGEVIAEGPGPGLQHVVKPDRAAYRVEVTLASSRPDAAPWLLSNPVYVNGWPEPPAAPRPSLETFSRYRDGPVGADVGIEKNDASKGVFEVAPVVNGTRLRVRFALGGSSAAPAYVALGMAPGVGLSGYDRLIFTVGADKPMRLWVQLGMPGATGRGSWRRSVYVDDRTREVVVRFADLAAPAGASGSPPLAEVGVVTFTVDGTHTPLGTAGSFWIDDVRFARERGRAPGGNSQTAGEALLQTGVNTGG